MSRNTLTQPVQAVTVFAATWISPEIVLGALSERGPDRICAQVSQKNRENFYLIRIVSLGRLQVSWEGLSSRYTIQKEKVYLSLKGGVRIPCQSVLTVGKSEDTIILAFRRHGPDGSDLIPPDNEKVTLHLSLGGPDIALPFDITKMRFLGRVDL